MMDDFEQLIAPHRTELLAHGYRMLGSMQDAEDALQEAMVRAWKGMDGFEGRASFRTWIYRIVTNCCLRMIERRPTRVLPLGLDPGAGLTTDQAWLEPFPDGHLGLSSETLSPEARYELRESVELAFVVALQVLPPRQRAVLVLRDVLGFSAAETAEALETTAVSVNSALQRARRTVEERTPEQSQQVALKDLGDAAERRLIDRLSRAWRDGDVDAIVGTLAEDARFAMPPMPMWYQGHEPIRAFLIDSPLRFRWKDIPVRANGQIALASYRLDPEIDRERYIANSIDVVTIRGDRVAEITAFLTPEIFPRFGLPPAQPGD